MKKIVLLLLSVMSIGLASAEPLPLKKRLYISGEYMELRAHVHGNNGPLNSVTNDKYKLDGQLLRVGYHVADNLAFEVFGWEAKESDGSTPFDRVEGIGGGIRYFGFVTDSLAVSGFAGYGQSKFDFNNVERKINGASFGAGLEYFLTPGFSAKFEMQSYADDDIGDQDFTFRGYSYGIKISMVLGGGGSSGGDDDEEGGDEDEEGDDDEEGGDDEEGDDEEEEEDEDDE